MSMLVTGESMYLVTSSRVCDNLSRAPAGVWLKCLTAEATETCFAVRVKKALSSSKLPCKTLLGVLHGSGARAPWRQRQRLLLDPRPWIRR